MADDTTADVVVSDALDFDDPSTVARIVAPVAAIAATWLVRKVLESGYRAATGNEPPNAGDRGEALHRVILWAAATAAAVAIVNVAIDRYVGPHTKA